MHKPLDHTSPRCSKCSQPMAWHSDQPVSTREGDLMVRVYECENCDRLAAYSDQTMTKI